MAKGKGSSRSGGGRGRRTRRTTSPPKAESYRHSTEDSPLRPEVGTQAQFRKKKPPATYKYDSSLSPAMDWDGQNAAREQGEALIAEIAEQTARLRAAKTDDERKAAVEAIEAASQELKALSTPFLNWAGKAERLSFDVPTLPLFVHERLSTEAIIATLRGHRKDKQLSFAELFADPQHSITDQVLRAYEHRDKWVNRMVLGDSLVVMNSLLHYESMGGKVQMIYMDPPYGVKFGSNFQPFVRKRDVRHGDDEDMTREPEMVQAYRDTWELGLHSYLTYLRDRLLICRELLAPSGSVFVQISDENVHHVRQVLQEVFGPEAPITTIVFQKTSSEAGRGVANVADYLLWFCKDPDRLKVHRLFRLKQPGEPGAKQYVYVRSPDGSEIRKMTPPEVAAPDTVPDGWRVCRINYPLTSQDLSPTRTVPFEFEGVEYWPGGSRKNRHWSVSPDKGLPTLVEKGLVYATENALAAIMYLEYMPGSPIGNVWLDTGTGSLTDEQVYVVQTAERVLERCILLATDAGDLVLDPTCGSGTTAYVAERWGRRWITIDTSRVPLALARQRLLVATYPYYKLNDESRGPSSGFEYRDAESTANRKQDGYGIRLQHTLSSIAGDEDPNPIIFRDQPEIAYTITRVSGPFVVEATIPTPVDWEGDGIEDSGAGAEETHAEFVSRMLEVLRKSPVLRLDGGKTVALEKVRPPAKSLSLSAEALVDATAPGQSPTLQDAAQEAIEKDGKALPFSKKPVAIVFGPENGSISEKLVYEAAREAHAKHYTHVYVIGFGIEANARMLVEKCEEVIGVRASYVEATRDIMMGDLLKNMRSSQIFSVCGLPEIELRKVKGKDGAQEFEVELLGLDVFDPVTMETVHRRGDDVPAWFLDTNYNGLCFHVCQAFFPRTQAWDSIKKALRGAYDEGVWDHLAGTTSAPFDAGDQGQVAVKVIDDRGNELLVVKELAGS